MLKEGQHRARVIDAAVGSSKKGVPLMEIMFEVIGSNSPGVDPDIGKRISYVGYFAEGAAEFVFSTMACLGWKKGDGPGVMIGKEEEIIVANKVYEGRTYQTVMIPNSFQQQEFRTPKSSRLTDEAAATALSRLMDGPTQSTRGTGIGDGSVGPDDDPLPF